MTKHLKCYGCRVCGFGKMETIDSRQVILGGVSTVRRRKRCPKCKARYSTLELPLDMATEILKDE